MLLDFTWGVAMFTLGYVLSEWLFRYRQSPTTKQDLKEMEQRIMSELTDTLNAIRTKIEEGTSELTAKIAALEATLTTDVLSPESQTALNDLKAAAQTLADIVPNEPK